MQGVERFQSMENTKEQTTYMKAPTDSFACRKRLPCELWRVRGADDAKQRETESEKERHVKRE